MKADEFTHKYFKSKPDVFVEADISKVLRRLKDFSKGYNSFEDYLIDLIKYLDSNNNGVICFDELVVGLKNLGINLSY